VLFPPFTKVLVWLDWVFFDPHNIDEMAQKMAQILIKKYSWEKMAKETLEVYKEAIIL